MRVERINVLTKDDIRAIICFSIACYAQKRCRVLPPVEVRRRYRRAHLKEAAARMRRYRREKPEMFRRLEANRKVTPERRRKFNAYHKLWKARNQDKVRAYMHKRRAAKSSLNTLTASQIKRQRQKQQGSCFYCYRVLDNNGNGHIDHMLPLSRGGHNTLKNIVIACVSCNLLKGNKTASEFGRHMLQILYSKEELQAKGISLA